MDANFTTDIPDVDGYQEVSGEEGTILSLIYARILQKTGTVDQ